MDQAHQSFMCDIYFSVGKGTLSQLSGSQPVDCDPFTVQTTLSQRSPQTIGLGYRQFSGLVIDVGGRAQPPWAGAPELCERDRELSESVSIIPSSLGFSSCLHVPRLEVPSLLPPWWTVAYKLKGTLFSMHGSSQCSVTTAKANVCLRTLTR